MERTACFFRKRDFPGTWIRGSKLLSSSERYWVWAKKGLPLVFTEHSSWSTIPFILPGIALMRMAALHSNASHRKGELVFAGSVPVQMLLAFASAACLTICVWTWKNSALWESLSLAAASPALLLAWPSRISSGPQGLRRTLWWKRTVIIPWNDLVMLERDGYGGFRVYGRKQETIAFSRYHVAPVAFEREMFIRSGLRAASNTSPNRIVP